MHDFKTIVTRNLAAVKLFSNSCAFFTSDLFTNDVALYKTAIMGWLHTRTRTFLEEQALVQFSFNFEKWKNLACPKLVGSNPGTVYWMDIFSH